MVFTESKHKITEKSENVWHQKIPHGRLGISLHIQPNYHQNHSLVLTRH
jgi:hypothetical protein